MKIINARTWIIANGIAFGVAWKITNKILKILFLWKNCYMLSCLIDYVFESECVYALAISCSICISPGNFVKEVLLISPGSNVR